MAKAARGGGPQLPTSLLWRPGHGTDSVAEAENSQGAWARGRARAGGRSQGPPPPRPSGCPPRPPRARRSRRPEEQEEEERSEPSPGALRDRVPGGGGGGSAPAGEFILPLPT
ncbi:guanine nucleotide-binding protein G(I)/G(S)/G(O) subunit gamma-12 isoform X1 [Neofelis nebulosa]|uniref:guanine nucleotide-binding protein G(I)/G(S)/G(O) subunit gamma-12 isoform X1 n=1 Tax=Neofelis nebulosa TaxID=61452 RepID=UPI00272B11E5|nr:guanine nucleotide-binding protein G(I)/G(S)/G(O) subunit gamma-12 isoform X1 [Neofelis nebulosa]